MKKGIIKHKVTHDYILDLYDKAKKMKDQKKKAKALKNIKILSNHIGEYLIKPVD
tara:strand:- start:6824 stop:6988 length:165 start_codon:yes stop_codon:yes gene_type:complete